MVALQWRQSNEMAQKVPIWAIKSLETKNSIMTHLVAVEMEMDSE